MKTPPGKAQLKVLPHAGRHCKNALLVLALLAVASSGRRAGAEDLPPPPADNGAPPADAPAPPAPADPGAPPPPDAAGADAAAAATAESLPDIEARAYPIEVVRPSHSKIVFLLQAPAEGKLPDVGRLILLKDPTGAPAMAVRALKNYPDKHRFAVKGLRVYPGTTTLERKQSFQAIEKIADLAPVVLSERDKKDLKEVEEDLPPPPADGAGAPPAVEPDAPATTPGGPEAGAGAVAGGGDGFDKALDHGSSPNPQKESDDDSGDDDSYNGMSVEEKAPIDPHFHWLTAGFGFIGNNADQGSGQFGPNDYYAGAGLNYAYTLSKDLWIRGWAEDSLAVEGGFYFYKVANFSGGVDSFSVYALKATVRYTAMLSEDFGFFGFLGFLKNVPLALTTAPNDRVTIDGLNKLSAFLPSFGGGALFRVGPQWYIRADLGYDMAGVGIVLRF